MKNNQQEQLNISGFAGLTDAEIALGRINLFIGPQASGKSVAAKLLYFFKSFCEAAIDAIAKGQSYNVFLEERARQFDHYFPPAFRSANGFRSEFVLNGKKTVIEGGKKVAISIHSPAWEHLYNEAASQCNQANRSLVKNSLTPKLAVAILYKKIFDTPMPTPQIFIPDGRSDYLRFVEKATLIQKSQYVQDLVDPFMSDFLSVYTWARDNLGKTLTDWTEVFDPGHITSIFRGNPIEKDGETHIQSEDGRIVPLNFASSGQKEMIPVFKILAFLLNAAKTGSGDNIFPVYLEEPETHLFPESQINAVKVIAQVFNQVPLNQIIITTHSPYVAATMNNLLYADHLSATTSLKRRIEQIIPAIYWLKHSEFKSYRFGNGHVSDAINHETQLIQADIIDNASNIIGDIFDSLLELDNEE